jgi:DnaJ-class molecular chaperone
MNRRNVIIAIISIFVFYSIYKMIAPDCKWCGGNGMITVDGYELQCRDCNGTGKKQ